jgi:chitinase
MTRGAPRVLLAVLGLLAGSACSSGDSVSFPIDGQNTPDAGNTPWHPGSDAASAADGARPPFDDAAVAPDASGPPNAHDAGGGGGDAASHTDAAPPSSGSDYAPYFPTWTWGAGGYAYTSLVDLKAKSGLSEVTIAFVLSNGGCNTTQDIEQNIADVHAFIAAGGHVKASFGGADGAYVESKCANASALATAIEGFVDATGITDLDFDIEQDPVLTDAVNAMRAQALKTVQDAKGIKVAFTLAANPSPGGGLTAQGQSVVSHAVAAGVTVSHVNLMTMDYGDSFGGKPLAPVVLGSLNDGHAQLMQLVPGISSDAAWRMLGVIPMIGKNDDAEVFSLDDATKVAQFAQTNHLGLVSFWSIDRDQPGSDPNTSSTVESTPFAFHDIFEVVTH